MLKEGYIEVFVFENGTGEIMNSYGFGYEALTQMQEQMKDPAEFENMKEFIYCFKPEYWTPQTDHMGRVEVPGYWGFKEDEYTKKKTKEYKNNFKKFVEENT